MKKTIIHALFVLSLCLPVQKAWAQTPTAPTNFNTSAVTDNNITLTWGEVTDDTVDGYIIQTGENPIISADTLRDATSTTHTVSDLDSEQAYTFTITSYSLRGAPPAYSYSTGTTINATTLAVAPADLSGSITFSNVTSTSLTLALTTTTAGTSYLVLRFSSTADRNNYSPQNGADPSPGGGVIVSSGEPTSASFDDTNLEQANMYYYRIYAYTGSGPTTHYAGSFLDGEQQTLADDTTPPSILSISASPTPFLAANDMLTVVMEFSEPMNKDASPTFSFSQGTWTSTSASWTNNSTFTAIFSHPTEEENEGTVNVSMTATDLEDVAENALVLTDNTSTAFNIDTKRPTAEIELSPTVINIPSPTLNITVTYSEAMKQDTPPIFTFNKSSENFTLNSTASGWNSSTKYAAVYNYNTGNTAEITDGVEITVTGARDTTGTGNVQQSASSKPFSINTQVPTAGIGYSDEDGRISDGQTLTITATLSEPIKDDPPLKISISMGETELVDDEMTKTTTTTYTYSFTSNSNGANGTATITLSGAQNSGGNPINPTPTSGATFIIDNAAPTTPALAPNNGALNIATNTNLSITFEEPVRKVADKEVTLYKSESNTSIAVATFSLTGTDNDPGQTTLSFTPPNALEQGKKYYVSIPSDALVDLAGNAFAGLSGTSGTSAWSFTTFAPPEIDMVKLSGTATAACLGDTIAFEGNFFTGITSVRFGNDPDKGVASGESLILEDDDNLKVVVPANAQFGKIHLIKAADANSGNPEATDSTSADIEIGPRSAILSAGSETISNVCNTGGIIGTGSITSTPIKVTIAGGNSNYTVKYKVVGTADTTFYEAPSYENEKDIDVTPRNNGANLISLTEVVDSKGCAVPLNALSGTFSVQKNILPTVSAGGSAEAEPNEVSICLGDRQNFITLNEPTLGKAPTHEGDGGVSWKIEEGLGNITNSTDTTLTPTYELFNGDVLNGKVSFKIESTNVPAGCESTSDEITLKFASQPIANSGGEGGVLYHCWNGSGSPEVPLNGTISGAQGYKWTAVGDTVGVFSDTTSAAPTYTFSQKEITRESALVTLTATGGTCGGGAESSVPDTLTIQLVTPPINSFSSSTKTDVCKNETVTYALTTQRNSSTFSWRRNGNSIDGSTTATVKWEGSSGQDTLSVVETNEHGCEAPPIEKVITIHDTTNPGIEGSIFSYGNRENRFELKAIEGVMGKTVEFAGEGVFSVGEGQQIKKYYFDPSNFWEIKGGDGVQETSLITYKYKIDVANCYSELGTQEFIVYDANQAFTVTLLGGSDAETLSLNSEGKYEICRNQPVKIAISEAFIGARPITEGHLFKGFTIDKPLDVAKLDDADGPFINTPPSKLGTVEGDTIIHALAWRATLYPERLRRESETDPTVSEIEINGWQYIGANESRDPPPGYGRIVIIINDPPTLSYDAMPEQLCSNNTPLQLTKNEIDNPGRDYSFFSSTANFITGDGTTGFSLKPGATELFADTDNYPPPTKGTVSYAYKDINGCSDTTSFDITIVKTPPTPTLDNFVGKIEGEDPLALCVIDSKVPTATVNNTASYTYTPEGEGETEQTENAAIRWYSERSLESSTFLEETEAYTPSTEAGDEDININRNGITNYYVTQQIGGCISAPFEVSYEVLNIPSFSWNKSCIGGETEFSVDLGSTPLKKLIWEVQENEKTVKVEDMIDVLGRKSFSHTFSELGQDTVTMTITSARNCSTSSTQLVTMLNDIVVSSNATYLESFNQDDGGFVALAAPNSQEKTVTWKHGEMGANKNNRPTRIEDTKVWATSLDGPYGNGERSYLYVGCIDFSETESPLLAFDSWVNVNEGNDGAVLQYSTDRKVINDSSKVWKAIGGVNSGVNWYDRTLIESIPNTAINNYGWSSENTTWQSSKHALQTVKSEQIDNTVPVIFRFTFAASAGAEKNHGGFALDNLRIGEKTRIVLLENFTNKGNSANRVAEKSQSDEIKKFLPKSIGKQLVIINYHVGFPSSDPFNLDNPGGPSARALYYGVQTTPTAVLDGSVAPDNDGNGQADLFKLWGERANDLRSLDPSQAEMAIEISEPGNQEKVSIEVSITPSENIEETKLYIAILEKKIAKNTLPTDKQSMIATGEDTLEYVFKEMLPSSAGVYIGMLQQQQEAYKFGPYDWYPKFSKIYSENIAIVAFLQNDKTKNIYQAAFEDNITLPAVITATGESNPIDYVKVYPNPADKSIRINLPHQAQSNTYVRLIGPMGRVVKDVVVPRGKTTQQIDTQLLAEGIYVLKIESEKGTSAYKKIVIAHNDK